MNLLLIALLVLFALFLLLQLYPVYSSYKARGKEIPQLTGVVSDEVLQNKRYLLYFWSPRCGMCRGMTPIIEKLTKERNDIAKIDAAQHPESARALGVMGTPALVLIEDGKISKTVLGAKPENVILQMLTD